MRIELPKGYYVTSIPLNWVIYQTVTKQKGKILENGATWDRLVGYYPSLLVAIDVATDLIGQEAETLEELKSILMEIKNLINSMKK